MRIDKFLKNSRIIKRRSLAKEAAEKGRVFLNGKTAKASAEVKPGDVIEVVFGNSRLKVRVLDLIDGAKKSNAEDMYEVIHE